MIAIINQHLVVNFKKWTQKQPSNFKEMKNTKKPSWFDDTDVFALLMKAAFSEFELENCGLINFSSSKQMSYVLL